MELSLNQEQKQVLSGRMIQSSEILQMAAANLEEYLEEQALDNPVIEIVERQPERDDKGELEKYQWIYSHDEQNRYLYQRMEAEEEDRDEWNVDTEEPESLSDHLWSQLLTGTYSFKEERALHFLLDSLDSRGYYTDSLEEAGRECGLSAEHMTELLGKIQELEPAGVGARNLEECLCLQLRRQDLLTGELERFINTQLVHVAKNQLPVIARSMKLSLDTVKEYCRLIQSLNPKPGAVFSDSRQLSYVIPDVVIVKFKGHFDILLNESLYPDIALNGEYVRMSREQDDPEVRQYLLEKIHQAEWLKQCVAQRNSTLFSVARMILSWQMDFFRFGPAALKPLRMADAADALDIHESTVSRAAGQKYLQCSWGIYPLTYFFAKAAPGGQGRNTEREEEPEEREKSGEPDEPERATVADVKRALADIISSENKKKPYSDRLLEEQLKQKGFAVSRRTIAKYRREEEIPDASGRKEY